MFYCADSYIADSAEQILWSGSTFLWEKKKEKCKHLRIKDKKERRSNGVQTGKENI